MMRTAMILAAGATLLTVCAGDADARDRKGQYAHTAILRGDLATAEKTLRADQRVFPDRPEVLLNLAIVYAQTGRADAARQLYNHVLAEDAVDLTLTRDRIASSHAIARAGLAQLDAPVATPISAQ